MEKWAEGGAAEALVKRELKVNVTDDDVKKFYDDNPAQFEKAEMVRASHILLGTRDMTTQKELTDDQKAAKRKQLEDILKRARAGEERPEVKPVLGECANDGVESPPPEPADDTQFGPDPREPAERTERLPVYFRHARDIRIRTKHRGGPPLHVLREDGAWRGGRPVIRAALEHKYGEGGGGKRLFERAERGGEDQQIPELAFGHDAAPPW